MILDTHHWKHSLRVQPEPERLQPDISSTQKFWDSVLWSDETKLDLFGPMDQHYVWRKKNEAYAENNTSAYRFKHGGAC